MTQQEAVSEELQSQAVSTVECDVPVGWSLDDWRTVRELVREVTAEPEVPWWRRPLRALRR